MQACSKRSAARHRAASVSLPPWATIPEHGKLEIDARRFLIWLGRVGMGGAHREVAALLVALGELARGESVEVAIRSAVGRDESGDRLRAAHLRAFLSRALRGAA